MTYGFPYAPAYSWVAKASGALNVEIVNKGICGETTGEMVYRFASDVIADKPDIAIIMGGSNDAFAEIAEAEVAQNIRLMVEQAVRHSIRPVIGLPIPCCSYREERLLQAYRQHIAAFCDRNNIDCIDFYAPMLSEDGSLRRDLQIDGLHPNEAGYLVMASTAIPILQTVIYPEQCEQHRLVDEIDGK